MSRPVVQHDGFLVPNAATVSNPRMAEPDRIDFNTIAHALWGVIEGCEVTVSGRTASITGGMAVVNGILVAVTQTSTSLGTGGAQDRFDLIAVDQGGTVRVIIGQYSNDPVFPDPPKDVTVLAAIFAPATQSNFTENVVDKRKFLQKQLLTKIDSGEMLIRNANGTGNHYSVTGGGLTSWLGDTTLWRTGPGTLRVQSKLTVDDSLTVGGEFTADSLTAVNRVKASNIESGTTMPTGPLVQQAKLFQDESNGKVFVRQGDTWQELATMSSTIPVGTVITSLEKPAVMEPKGWVALNGQTVTEATHPRLFTLDTLLRYVTAGTAEAQDRVMALPNLQGLFPMVSFGRVGDINQPTMSNGQPRVNNLVSLTTANMPRHKHSVDAASGGGGSGSGSIMGRSGQHNHEAMQKNLSGPHTHNIYDPGHAHYGMGDDAPDMFFTTPTSFAIGTRWGGRNKIDGPIEDGTHTYSVEPVQWTGRATTGVHLEIFNPVEGEVFLGDGQHQHQWHGGGDHTHDLRFDNSAFVHDHDVTEQEVGGNAAFDVTPVSFTLYAYVRS